jgi:rare lipoprotein A
LRLNNPRARALSGALLGTTIVVAVPSAASSDAPPGPTPAPPVATKASSSLAVHGVRRDVLAGGRVFARGILRPVAAGRAVALQVFTPKGRWITVERDRTDARGRYVLRWRATQTGTRRMRIAFGGGRRLASTRRALGRVRVYRQAVASWYGPGLYGGRLACGGTLTAGTLGVAHKTLPCGTKVTLRYRGRTVRVPVVDRGPFVGNREFDLTAATKHRLGFGSTGLVMTTR